MKKIVIFLLTFLWALSVNAQDRVFNLGDSQKKETLLVTPPASFSTGSTYSSNKPRIEIRGKNKKPDVAARIIESFSSISDHGMHFVPVITHNDGYGKNGDISYIYVDGKKVSEVQFLDETEKSLLPMLDAASTVSTTDGVLRACPTQLAALRSAYEIAVEKAKKMQQEYEDAKNKQRFELSQPQGVRLADNYSTQTANTPVQRNTSTMYQRYDGQVASNAGYGQFASANTSYPTTTTVVPQCDYQGVKFQYPELTDVYLQTGDIRSYKPLKYQYGSDEYWRVKKCVTGKNWVQRNAWAIAGGTVLGILTTAIIANNTGRGSSTGGGAGGENPQIPTEPHRGTN